MKIGKNAIYIIGLAIFLGAMLVMSDIMLVLFAPLITMFGAFALAMLFLMVFLGAWMMKKGSKP